MLAGGWPPEVDTCPLDPSSTCAHPLVVSTEDVASTEIRLGTEASWTDSMPEIYDRCLGPALFAPVAAHLADLATASSPRRVVELAAGTGIVTGALVRALPDADIVATDLNPAMVSWAADRIGGVTWRQADAQNLDFPDASFDLALCSFGVMFFADRRAAFADVFRLLAPDGTFLFTVWDTVELSPFPAALVSALEAVLPENPPSFVARVPHGYSDSSRMSDDLQAAGWSDFTIRRVVLSGTAASARSLAEGFCLGTPLRFALQERGSLPELTEAIAADMSARLGTGSVTGDLAILVINARRATSLGLAAHG